MTKDEGWKLDRYSPEDAPDSLQLMRKVFGDSELATPAFADWQFQRSPAGAAIGVLAREAATGRLIGQAATIPVSVRLSGKVRTAGLALDPLIDPDYPGPRPPRSTCCASPTPCRRRRISPSPTASPTTPPSRPS